MDLGAIVGWILRIAFAAIIFIVLLRLGFAALRSASAGGGGKEEIEPEDVADLDVFFVCLLTWMIAGGGVSWLALGLVVGGLSLTRENSLVFVVVLAVNLVVQGTGRTPVQLEP